MNAPTRPSLIPAEALARQARLQAALQGMERRGASLEPTPLLALREGLAGRSELGLEGWLESVAKADLAEEACECLRASRRDARNPLLVEALLTRLTPLAAKAQQRRAARWQLDTRRAHARLRYRKTRGAIDHDDGDLHTLFLQAFRLEGLLLALDLGKRPRALLTLGLPLPAQAGGLEERLDLVLKREPAEPEEALLARLNRRLPEGLQFHGIEFLPGFAGAICDLALASHWRWEVSAELHGTAVAGIANLVAADGWPWERTEAKTRSTLDLRALLLDPRWEGSQLLFCTPAGALQGVNPLKALGALLQVPPSAITGLCRTAIELKPDLRLAQADRFAPKLKNMYEDAVLLAGGSNITLVDEDDDEPLLLP